MGEHLSQHLLSKLSHLSLRADRFHPGCSPQCTCRAGTCRCVLAMFNVVMEQAPLSPTMGCPRLFRLCDKIP